MHVTNDQAPQAVQEWTGLDDPRVRPLTPTIGAEIVGIDVGEDVDRADMQLVRDALHRYSVIVLRDQKLTPGEQVRFAKHLGPLRTSFLKQFAPEDTLELTRVSNIKRDGKPIGLVDAGALWHTDGSYLQKPDMYTVLYALEIPERNGEVLGDTLFVSTAEAYDALSSETKARIDGRRAMHSLVHHVKKKEEANFSIPKLTDAQRAAMPDVEHPIIRIHPITGRKCIYVTHGHTRAIVDMSEQGSEKLLTDLCEHLVQPRFL